jgi:hypothetical protein
MCRPVRIFSLRDAYLWDPSLTEELRRTDENEDDRRDTERAGQGDELGPKIGGVFPTTASLARRYVVAFLVWVALPIALFYRLGVAVGARNPDSKQDMHCWFFAAITSFSFMVVSAVFNHSIHADAAFPDGQQKASNAIQRLSTFCLRHDIGLLPAVIMNIALAFLSFNRLQAAVMVIQLGRYGMSLYVVFVSLFALQSQIPQRWTSWCTRRVRPWFGNQHSHRDVAGQNTYQSPHIV